MVKYPLQARWCLKRRNCHQRNVNVTQLPTCTFIYRHLSTQKTGQRIVSTSMQFTFQCGVLCNWNCIVRSSETLIRISEVRSVKLLGSASEKSGHSKHTDRPTAIILTMVIRAQDERTEFRLNWNVDILALIVNFKWNACRKWTSSLKLVVILAQCCYTIIAQRIFKYSDIQYIRLTLDKNLNSLIYRTLFYVNI